MEEFDLSMHQASNLSKLHFVIRCKISRCSGRPMVRRFNVTIQDRCHNTPKARAAEVPGMKAVGRDGDLYVAIYGSRNPVPNYSWTRLEASDKWRATLAARAMILRGPLSRADLIKSRVQGNCNQVALHTTLPATFTNAGSSKTTGSTSAALCNLNFTPNAACTPQRVQPTEEEPFYQPHFHPLLLCESIAVHKGVSLSQNGGENEAIVLRPRLMSQPSTLSRRNHHTLLQARASSRALSITASNPMLCIVLPLRACLPTSKVSLARCLMVTMRSRSLYSSNDSLFPTRTNSCNNSSSLRKKEPFCKKS